MSYRYEKTETGRDLVFSGWENGIAMSPHKGVANLQAVNIATETKEVMCSFARTQQSQSGDVSATHTITPVDGTHLSTSFALVSGVWINVSASTITNLSTGNHYIQNSNGTGSGGAASSFQVSNFYNSSLTGSLGSTGTATFTLVRVMGQGLQAAIEPYSNGSQQYRYYVLDSQGLVWVQDSAAGTFWFLPEINLITGATGIAVLNGWLHIFINALIFCKPTVNLGDTTSISTNWAIFSAGQMLTSNTHFGFSGHQGKIYYTDGNFLGSIFPSTSLLTGVANIQSYASYTAVSTTGTISQLISGTIPYPGPTGSNTTRIPAVFFHALTGSAANPAAVTLGTVYYIKYIPNSSGFVDTSTFEVYAAASGGAALDIATSAVGTQYFSTYYPTSTGGTTTLTFTPQRLNLPFFEIAQCMAELGSLVIIGCKGNTMYPWDQIAPTPGDLIPLPENNVTSLLTVNNMVYVLAGNKGNVYITNGSSASAVLSVPDYCAGVAGTQASYIEPYFTWGGIMYLRGRIYFSILDQTAAKAGNCGGVWSFIPTQNFFFGQDVGLSLRVENQSSYGTYSGVSTLLIPNQTQTAISPQYWNIWYSSTSSPTYGIDSTSTTPSTTAIVETDLAPTGTFLDKQTMAQIEYKLAAPLVNGEAVAINYRLNATDAFATCGSAIVESTTGLSGIFTANFEKSQWLQLQAVLTPLTSTSSSFVRLIELRVRQA